MNRTKTTITFYSEDVEIVNPGPARTAEEDVRNTLGSLDDETYREFMDKRTNWHSEWVDESGETPQREPKRKAGVLEMVLKVTNLDTAEERLREYNESLIKIKAGLDKCQDQITILHLLERIERIEDETLQTTTLDLLEEITNTFVVIASKADMTKCADLISRIHSVLDARKKLCEATKKTDGGKEIETHD